jgi:hypothetical protein
LYDSVFNDDITTQKLLVPLAVFQDIEARKRQLQRQVKKQVTFDSNLLFLIDGAHHVLFTVSELCEAMGVDPLSEIEAKALIPKAIDLLKQLVKSEAGQDEAFTASRFFKDARTKAKIQRMIAEGRPNQKTTPSRRRRRLC